MEINIVPKFLDEAATPVAQSVGNTLSSVWTMVFGGIDIYAQKVHHKRVLNLNKFKEELEEKVSSIPVEKIVEPPLHVIGPALEASKYYFEDIELRKMFSNLIASSINSDFTSIAHPSFVEIIKQLSPDEAKIFSSLDNNGLNPLLTLKAVSKGPKEGFVEIKKNYTDISYRVGCINPELSSSYIENLNRLGLISIDSQIHLIDETHYDKLIKRHEIQVLINYITSNLDRNVEYKKHSFTRTEFGEKFYIACILE